jgi:hypothetical protein
MALYIGSLGTLVINWIADYSPPIKENKLEILIKNRFKSYSIFILNNYRYDNYLNFNCYNELNVSEGHICNFLQ